MDGWMGGWVAMGLDVWPWGWMDVWPWGLMDDGWMCGHGDGCTCGRGDGHVDRAAAWGRGVAGTEMGVLWGRGGSGRCQRRAVPVGHKNDPIRSDPFRSPFIRGAPPTSSPRAAPLQATPLADVIAARQRPREKTPSPPAIDVIKKRRAQLCPPLTSSRRAASP